MISINLLRISSLLLNEKKKDKKNRSPGKLSKVIATVSDAKADKA